MGALPNTKGKCPLCQKEVFSKCGEIKLWHWAHKKGENCDNWYEPETEWHKNWKYIFGKEYSEITITKDGIKHRADIQTKDNVIIELQNSPLQKPIIRRRENFYGEKMIWIINGMGFKDNFRIHPEPFPGENYSPTEYGFVDKTTGEVIDQKSLPKKDDRFFWEYPRSSWNDVQRNVFIDFGDGNLFWVKDGMGTGFGKGRQIKKEDFIKKYGGDLDVFSAFVKEQKEKDKQQK